MYPHRLGSTVGFPIKHLHHSPPLKYRSGIDALRAFVVLSVIIFYAILANYLPNLLE